MQKCPTPYLTTNPWSNGGFLPQNIAQCPLTGQTVKPCWSVRDGGGGGSTDGGVKAYFLQNFCSAAFPLPQRCVWTPCLLAFHGALHNHRVPRLLTIRLALFHREPSICAPKGAARAMRAVHMVHQGMYLWLHA